MFLFHPLTTNLTIFRLALYIFFPRFVPVRFVRLQKFYIFCYTHLFQTVHCRTRPFPPFHACFGSPSMWLINPSSVNTFCSVTGFQESLAHKKAETRFHYNIWIAMPVDVQWTVSLFYLNFLPVFSPLLPPRVSSLMTFLICLNSLIRSHFFFFSLSYSLLLPFRHRSLALRNHCN